MVIKKDKKIVVKENSIQKTTRLRLEDEAAAEKKIKDDKLADIEEKKRQAEIIIPYLKNLDRQLKEKDLDSFWSFPDRTGFKKIRGTYKDIQKMVKENIKKYKNRKLAYTSIHIHYNEKNNTLHRKADIWLGVSLCIYNLDDKCNLDRRPAWGCHYVWQSDDFKLTKLSFNLMEEIMYVITDRVTTCTSLMGFNITKVIKDIKKNGVDLSEHLNPLAGV